MRGYLCAKCGEFAPITWSEQHWQLCETAQEKAEADEYWSQFAG